MSSYPCEITRLFHRRIHLRDPRSARAAAQDPVGRVALRRYSVYPNPSDGRRARAGVPGDGGGGQRGRGHLRGRAAGVGLLQRGARAVDLPEHAGWGTVERDSVTVRNACDRPASVTALGVRPRLLLLRGGSRAVPGPGSPGGPARGCGDLPAVRGPGGCRRADHQHQ